MTGHTHKFNRCECGAKWGYRGGGRERLTTDEQGLRWVEMHKTMTVRQIAEAEGLPHHRVYRAMVLTGLPLTDHRKSRLTRKPTVEQRRQQYREPIRLYEEAGWTLAQIGEHYHVSRERVRQWFVMAGVKDMPGKRVQARKEQRIAEQEAERDVPIKCPWGCGEMIPRRDMRGHLYGGPGKHLALRFGSRMDPARWDGVAADYAAGMKLLDIKAKWGMEASSVMRTVDAHGIPRREPTKHILPTRAASAARKERVLALYRTGKFSMPEIAKIEGCSDSRIHQIVWGAR